MLLQLRLLLRLLLLLQFRRALLRFITEPHPPPLPLPLLLLLLLLLLPCCTMLLGVGSAGHITLNC